MTRNTTTTPSIRCAECEGLGRVVYTTATGGLSTQTCTVCDGQGRLPICPVCGDEWCDR
jgi:DnaJ-class molecular chaperone